MALVQILKQQLETKQRESRFYAAFCKMIQIFKITFQPPSAFLIRLLVPFVVIFLSFIVVQPSSDVGHDDVPRVDVERRRPEASQRSPRREARAVQVPERPQGQVQVDGRPPAQAVRLYLWRC